MMKPQYERTHENQEVQEAIRYLETPTSKALKYECHMSDSQIKTVIKRLKEQDKIRAKQHPNDGRKVIYENKVSV